MTHAYSLALSPDGTKIHAGFLSEIKIFSTDRPGRQCVSRNLKPWFQRNIVSSIAINPIVPDLCALGTYSKMIGKCWIFLKRLNSLSQVSASFLNNLRSINMIDNV